MTVVAYRFSLIVDDHPTLGEEERAKLIQDARRAIWGKLEGVPGITLEFQFPAPWPHSRSIEMVRLDEIRAREMEGIIRRTLGMRDRSGFRGRITGVE